MVVTPWGNAEELRERKLAPGRGHSRDEVARNQRERLFAAMVAVGSEKGYERTAVADLVEVSGVSRSTFYEHFADFEDCFVATVEQLLDEALAVVLQPTAEEIPVEERVKRTLQTFLELTVAQPAAARLCLVEAYAAGARAVAPVRAAIDRLTRLAQEALEQMPEQDPLPMELVRGIVGGFYRVLYRRLESHREAELPALLPALWDWALGYRAPPRPLRLRSRRPAELAAEMPPFAAYDPEQRILRSFATVVAEVGYEQTTIADIAAAAKISQATFYAHFDDKADAMAAALDSSGAQLQAAVLPVARRAPDWPSAVCTALRAGCGFLAAEPAFAKMRMAGVYAAGPSAIAQRDAASTELLRTLMEPGFEDSPDGPELLLETIVGAIQGVFYDQIRSPRGVAGLPETAPIISYLALAPFLGAEAACAAATAELRRR